MWIKTHCTLIRGHVEACVSFVDNYRAEYVYILCECVCL